jgi:hypothetical protein
MGPRGIYSHSGRFTTGGIIRGLITGGLVGLMLGFIYPYVILYIPVVGSISFIISGGFGLVVGAVIGMALKRGKVRNLGVAALTALPAIAVAYYLSWVVWVYAFLHQRDADVPLLGLLLQPSALWEVIQRINEVGAWTVKGTTPTGAVLWVLWAAEATLVIGAAIFGAVTAVNHPFCENCDVWSEESKGVAVLGGEDPKALKERLMSDKLIPALEGLGPPSANDNRYAVLDLQSCPSCKAFHTLSAGLVVKKGNKTERAELMSKVLISTTEAEGIRALGLRLAGAPAAGSASAA